jgi:hypothetical protein
MGSKTEHSTIPYVRRDSLDPRIIPAATHSASRWFAGVSFRNRSTTLLRTVRRWRGMGMLSKTARSGDEASCSRQALRSQSSDQRVFGRHLYLKRYSFKGELRQWEDLLRIGD